MKNIFKSILLFSFLFSFANVSFGASIPLVTNTSFDSSKLITDNTGTGATSVNFKVNQNGGSVTETGLIWSLEYGFPRIENIDPAKPQMSGRVSRPISTINNPWEGEFSSSSNTVNFVHSLDLTSPDNIYNIRPYAINENGVGYGSVITYKTGLPDLVIHVGEDVVSGQKPITETSLLGWIDPFGYIHNLGNYRTTTSPIHILGEIATRNNGTGEKRYQYPVVTDIKDFLITYKTFVNNPTPSGYFSSFNSSGTRIQNLGIHFSEPRGTVQSYRLCADKDMNNFNSNGIVIESDENNNCTVWKDILVKRCPVINLHTASSGGEPGLTTTINWSVSNPPAIPGYDDKDPTCVASGSWSGSKTLSGTENIGPLNESKKYTYTLSCANVDGPCSDTETITICEEGKIWNPRNNKCEALSGFTGKLEVNPTKCEIGEGKSECSTNLTWSLSGTIPLIYIPSIERYNSDGTSKVIISNQFSGKDVKNSATPGEYEFFLYFNNKKLDSKLFSAVCVKGTQWDGDSCEKNKPEEMQSSLSVTPKCEIKENDSNCDAFLDWSITGNIPLINIPRVERDNLDDSIQLVSSGSFSNKNFPHSVTFGNYEFSLYFGEERLRGPLPFLAVCVEGTNWNSKNNKCEKTPLDGESNVDLLVNGSDNPPAVKFNSAVNLSWTSNGSHTNCKLSGGEFVGGQTVSPNGQDESSPLKRTVIYTLVCGNGPNNTDSVEVKVLPPNTNFDEI